MNPLVLLFKVFSLIAISFLGTFLLIAIFLKIENCEITKKDLILHRIIQVIYTRRFKALLTIFFASLTFFYLSRELLELFKALTNPSASSPWIFMDFDWFYSASKMLHNGLNPYQADLFRETFTNNSKNFWAAFNSKPGFVYPPNFLPLIFPLGGFSRAISAQIFFFVNLISLVFLFMGIISLIDPQSKVAKVACLVICLLIYGITYNLSMGQVSGISACFVIQAIVCAKKDKNMLAGFLLGISTFKPTLALLFIPYFLVKRRFTLVGCCLLISFILAFWGLMISKNYDILNFLSLYKSSSKLFFANYWNSPSLSPIRIDSGVISFRLFSGNPVILNLISILLTVTFILLIMHFIYRKQKYTHWSSKIDLSEVSLIACLSLITSYSQPTNAAILVLPVAYLINYLQSELKDHYIVFKAILLWTGIFCLTIHSHISYSYFLQIYTAKYYTERVPFIIRATIGSLPNYAIMGLTLSILTLANLSSKRKLTATDNQ